MISVTAYTSATTTYNCNPHTAMGTATGCDGDLSSLLNLTGTTHTNAGNYSGDAWSFNSANTNTNYNSASGTVNDSIAKAHATIHVTPYNVVFNSQPHTATGTATGCDGDLSSLLNLTGTTHTLPGDYLSDPWTFNSANTNTNYFSESRTVHDSIGYGTCTGSDPGGVILPPINSDGSSVYKRKGGSTIPVKFKVCDASGNSISNPYAVFLNYPQGGQLTMTGQIRGTVDNVNENGDTVVPDVAFTFTGGQWHFNMDTGNLTAGQTYTFRINLAFGPGITFTVGVK